MGRERYEMKNSNKKAIIIGALVLAILAGVFAAIYLVNKPSSYQTKT